MMRIGGRFLAVVVTVMVIAAVAKGEDVPGTYRFDGHALVRARERYHAGDAAVVKIVQELKANAEKGLADGPWAVVNKKGDLAGLGQAGPHDYVSIAPYYWPNPATANHLPYVDRDGQRNPEFEQYDAKPLMELTDHVDVLALTGYLTGDRRYSDRAAFLIRTWFLDPATRMNPNMDHCQAVKGVNEGMHAGVIEARRFIDMIDAVEMMRGTPSWTAQDDAGFKAWIGEFLQWMFKGRVALVEGDSKNNHGTWYDVQVVTYRLFTGDEAGAKQMLEEAKRKRIWTEIDPDGKQLEELARTRGFWYCEFNLNAMAQLAELGRRAGVDLWGYESVSGASIRAAVDWLVPYATGEKPWTYQQIQGLSAKDLMPVLRLAEVAWHEKKYEATVGKLVGDGVKTDVDYEHPLLGRAWMELAYPGE